MNDKNGFSTLLTVLITAVTVGVLTGVISYSYAASKKDLEIEDLKQQLSQVKEEGVDETANWKTYTNEEYGFSFKYPDEIVKKDGITNFSLDVLNKKPVATIGFSQREINKEVGDNLLVFKVNIIAGSLEEIKKMFVDYNPKETKIQVGNMDAVSLEFYWGIGGTIGNANTNVILLSKNGYVYEIECSYASEKDIKSMFNNILSTFQFTK